MTSPFNPLNAPTGLTPVASGSSPFPIPSFPSPFPQFGSQPPGQSPSTFPPGPSGLANAAQAGPSNFQPGPTGTSPFPLFAPQGEGSSPFPFLGTGNTPGANTPNLPRQLQNLSWTNVPRKPPPLSSVGDRMTKAGLDDMVRGMTEAETLIDRAIVVAREMQRLEEGTFADDGKDRSEGMEPGASGMPKLEESCFEYSQLLSTLLTLSNTTLFGALPVPLSAAVPESGKEPGEPAGPTEEAMDVTQRDPTLAELTEWAESRAALEFNRREAVKSAGKAVVDVLKGSGTK